MPITQQNINHLIYKAQQRFNYEQRLSEQEKNSNSYFSNLAKFEQECSIKFPKIYSEYKNFKIQFLTQNISDNDKLRFDNSSSLHLVFPELYQFREELNFQNQDNLKQDNSEEQDVFEVQDDLQDNEYGEISSKLRQQLINSFVSLLQLNSNQSTLAAMLAQYRSSYFFLISDLIEENNSYVSNPRFTANYCDKIYADALENFNLCNDFEEANFSRIFEEKLKEHFVGIQIEDETNIDDQSNYLDQSIDASYDHQSSSFILQAFSNPLVRVFCGLLLVGGLAAFVIGTSGLGGIVIGGVTGTKALIAATAGGAALALGCTTSTIGFFADKIVNQGEYGNQFNNPQSQDYNNHEQHSDDQEQQYNDVDEMHQSDEEKNNQDHDDLNGWQNNYQQ